MVTDDATDEPREAAIIFGGYDPAKYGIHMPGSPKAGLPHVVPRELGA